MTEPTLPAVFLSHGAPPLVDDTRWVHELQTWSTALPRPQAILVVSAHWEGAPLTIGSTATGTPLTYDFGGFPQRFYDVTYPAPGAPDLADTVAALMPDSEPVAHNPGRGLDHGAYVPLTVMYPEAQIPVLQISLPSLDPARLIALGQRLRPLRDEGVMIIGSGFTTHGLPFLSEFVPDATPPGWSVDFDAWASEMLAARNIDALIDFRNKAPGMPFAHPTVEHLAPLFVTLGAATRIDDVPDQVIDGFWMGLSKRSFQLR
ncbi:class III extradiol ring-cleavage dioxygenase [Rhodococcus opacus]|uniref:Class III extradiol ring-cleavage dioxygenase n=1 Tax=Rhodococcus opacus TaxID=37919 RepID=A0AAX3YSG9_RHOOP|nr:class III extradiol ring-cleavage dioxygenase [Rhodococcus opacus]MCZ4587548.1 class III extradiol ring-cleavage dioxygenase [Rhodococcus opacus]WLF51450.1 class III extradiol ring-cleavage dioxygenase [Rhodococcus opacus]